jgi:hypothetical protein
MDIFFQDPSEIPLPPAEVRLHDLQAKPYPDCQRIRIYLELTPFQQKPSLDLIVCGDHGELLASTSIIESLTRQVELTMHLRRPMPATQLEVQAVLYYLNRLPTESQPLTPSERLVIDQQSVNIQMPEAAE